MFFSDSRPLSLAAKSTILSYSFFAIVFCVAQFGLLWLILDDDAEFLQDSALSHLAAAQYMVEQRNIAGACDLLHSAHNKHLVDVFSVQSGERSFCWKPENSKSVAALANIRTGELIKTQHRNYRAEKVVLANAAGAKPSEILVVVGSLNNSSAARWEAVKANAARLTIPFLIALTSILGGTWLIQVPFRRMQARLKAGNATSSTTPLSILDKIVHTYEAQMASAATDASQESSQRLKDEFKLVEKTIGNSIFREVKASGGRIPYSFDSTMLRYDVNDYTKAYLGDPDSVQTMITEMSDVSSEIVSRYEGLQYDFAGDEFVVSFKDSPSISSKAMATAAIRDIFLAVDRLYPNNSVNFKVTLKASIHHSKNVLFEISIGFFLRGLNLIVGQRLISKVEDKNKNVLVMSDDHGKSLQELAVFGEPSLQDLKGIGEYKVSAVSKFVTIDDILNSRKFDFLIYYRSDLDIIKMLKFIATENSYAERMKIIECLKKIFVRSSTSELPNVFISTLSLVDGDSDEAKYTISSLLSAGIGLFTAQHWATRHSDVVIKLKSILDSRVASAALILLSDKADLPTYLTAESSILKGYQGKSFRPIGDSLLNQAKIQLNDGIFKKINSMINSKKPLEVATAIYTASAIIRYYRGQNPVQLSQFTEADKVIKKIKDLTLSSDDLISIRAKIETERLKGNL